MENSNIAQIKEKIRSAKAVSFDVFDTLILRLTARAEDVFRIMEHITGIYGFAEQREKLQTQCSIMVEQTRHEPHATFDDIYEYMEKNAELDLKGYTWSQLKSLELETEKNVIVSNEPMLEVFNYAKSLGKRVIAVSDMYLGKKEVMPILENCGYTGFDNVYFSADVKKTKYRMDIFELVARSENVLPENILHIGDNKEHDVENAVKCGFSAQLYEGNRNKALMPLYRSVSTGVSCCLENKDNSFWYMLGAKVGGPLYCGLIDKVKERIEEVKPDKMFFLARDGYNLYEVLNAGGLIDIESEYLYASRRSMLLCGMNKLDDEAKAVLPPYTNGQTVKEILDYLDLSSIDESAVQKCGFADFEAKINTEDDFDKFKNILVLEEKKFFKKADEERKCFEKYLNKTGFLDCNSLVFDCGWNGSSQYLLDRALSLMDYKGENSFIYAGLMNSDKCKRQLNGKKFKAILFDMNKNNMLYKRLERSIVLLELFFGAPHGSVWKYDDSEKGFEEESIEKEYAYKSEILRGITDFVKTAYPLMKKLNLQPTAEDCLEEIFRLIEKPTVEEAVNIGNLENVDGFVSKKNQKKYIAKLTKEDLKENPSELYWPQGIYARDDIDEEVKAYVREKTGVPADGEEKKAEQEQARPNVFKRVKGYIDQYGLATTAYLIKNKLKNNNKTPYELFCEQNERDNKKTENLPYRPLISFVIPVYNVLDNQLTECIDSVLNQTYDNFELILVDDKSTWESVPKVLKKYEKHPKITVIYRRENGHISRCTNTGIEAAKGEYIAFMDCDDVIAPNALYEITKVLNKDKTLDFIYTDEDKLTDDSKHRYFPHFKPDWSPDTFMSHMYTSHLSVYRRSITNEIGGLRVGFEGSQDYDFTMRFVEKTDRIAHIPKVLYYWRTRPESTASDLSSKPYVMEAMRKLKRETLDRRNIKGEIVYVPEVRQYRVVYEPTGNPLVSIIIPSKDNYEIINRCITSIADKTEYKNYEIIVVDNGSNAENKKKYAELCESVNAVYHYEKEDFNFSKMCNTGVKISKGNYLLFLNDDMEILDGDWLRRMLGHAQLDYTGAVGAKLLYPNSTTIQHCGVINIPGGPCHAFSHMDDNIIHYFCRNKLEYNYIAVTAACLCVSRKKFDEVKGFDETLTVAYNDMDLCFKLHEAGYYNVVRNDVVLYHYESYSRGFDISDEKKQRLLAEYNVLCEKHPQLKDKDPYFNVNFDPKRVDFHVNYDKFRKLNTLTGNNAHVSALENERAKVFIDFVNYSTIVEIEGWAFIAAMPLNNLNKKYVVLEDENGNSVLFNTNKKLRFDVSEAFGDKGNLNLSGFTCSFDKSLIKPGRYRVGVMVKNNFMRKKFVSMSDKYVTVE